MVFFPFCGDRSQVSPVYNYILFFYQDPMFYMIWNIVYVVKLFQLNQFRIQDPISDISVLMLLIEPATMVYGIIQRKTMNITRNRYKNWLIFLFGLAKFVFFIFQIIRMQMIHFNSSAQKFLIILIYYYCLLRIIWLIIYISDRGYLYQNKLVDSLNLHKYGYYEYDVEKKTPLSDHFIVIIYNRYQYQISFFVSLFMYTSLSYAWLYHGDNIKKHETLDLLSQVNYGESISLNIIAGICLIVFVILIFTQNHGAEQQMRASQIFLGVFLTCLLIVTYQNGIFDIILSLLDHLLRQKNDWNPNFIIILKVWVFHLIKEIPNQLAIILMFKQNFKLQERSTHQQQIFQDYDVNFRNLVKGPSFWLGHYYMKFQTFYQYVWMVPAACTYYFYAEFQQKAQLSTIELSVLEVFLWIVDFFFLSNIIWYNCYKMWINYQFSLMPILFYENFYFAYEGSIQFLNYFQTSFYYIMGSLLILILVIIFITIEKQN